MERIKRNLNKISRLPTLRTIFSASLAENVGENFISTSIPFHSFLKRSNSKTLSANLVTIDEVLLEVSKSKKTKKAP